MAIDPFDFFVPVPRPECPEDKVWPVSQWEQSEPVNAPVLADPVPDLHMIGVGVLGESGCLGLLRGEEALLCSANSKSRRDASRWDWAMTQYYNFLDAVSTTQLYCVCGIFPLLTCALRASMPLEICRLNAARLT